MNYDERYLKKKKQMEDCDHLFVKIKDGEWVGGNNSSDYEFTPATVECLKCGLSNKHMNMDIITRNKYDRILKFFNSFTYYLMLENDKIFKEKYSNQDKELNLISNGVIDSIHVNSYYKEALELNPNGSNEELFNIMKELHNEEIAKESCLIMIKK